MPQDIFDDIMDTILAYKVWEGDIKYKKKDGDIFWTHSIISPKCTRVEGSCGYTDIMFDITDKKEVERLKLGLEKLVEERTKELESEKKLISSIVNSQESIVVTSDGKKLTTANRAFYEFFEIDCLEEFMQKYGPCICDSCENDVDISQGYIKKDMGGKTWIEYMLERPHENFKVIIKKEIPHIFNIAVDKFEFEGQVFVTIVLTDITDLEMTKKAIEEMHKHTRDSIHFASLIQKALVPLDGALDPYFKDNFVIWQPKDIVGGDIYLFETLRNEDECLLMCIDCTGHGVPGAFVTMIVKAIEKEIVSKLRKHPEFDISPAKIMEYFNKTMKKLLRQETSDSLSNAGFDGGIIYYNKQNQILKFAGAETPLFYVEDGKVNIIKGNRYSVGYKKCDIGYEYKETILEVKEGMKFYITTDGYLDQNGGNKGFPFGKKRFKKIIEENYIKPMKEQREIFLKEWQEYKGKNEQNDDITVVGLEIGN